MAEKTTTQQQSPGRASWRTAVQGVLSTIISLGVVLPIVASIIDEELGAIIGDNAVAWVIGAAATVAAFAAALARIMAIPKVDAFLSRLGLSSSPEVTRTKE